MLFQIFLYFWLEIMSPVGTNGDTKSCSPGMLQPDQFPDEVIGNLVNEFDFQQRLPADELNDNPWGKFRIDVLVVRED